MLDNFFFLQKNKYFIVEQRNTNFVSSEDKTKISRANTQKKFYRAKTKIKNVAFAPQKKSNIYNNSMCFIIISIIND